MASSPSELEPQGPSAVEELANDDYKRRRFLKMVGGTGAAGALSMLIAACGSTSTTSTQNGTTAPSTSGGGKPTSASGAPPADTFGKGDLGIVNYALTLEYLEADFYSQVLDSGLFKGSKYLPTLQMFGEQEQEHVDALKKVASMLGKPAPKPKTDFTAALKSADTVVMNAATVENLGAAAYLGQAANIQSKDILASALAIHTVEARHASTLNQVLSPGTFKGNGPYLGILPDGAFGVGAPADAVLKQVQPFIKS